MFSLYQQRLVNEPKSSSHSTEDHGIPLLKMNLYAETR